MSGVLLLANAHPQIELHILLMLFAILGACVHVCKGFLFFDWLSPASPTKRMLAHMTDIAPRSQATLENFEVPARRKSNLAYQELV